MDNMILQKLMEKKKEQAPLDDDYKNAKMSMLEALKAEMNKSMGDGLRSGIKKVEVAAPDQAGLSKGLDLAKSAVGSDEGALGADSSASSEIMPNELDEGSEGDQDDLGIDLKGMDPEKLEKLLMMLQQMLGKGGSENG